MAELLVNGKGEASVAQTATAFLQPFTSSTGPPSSAGTNAGSEINSALPHAACSDPPRRQTIPLSTKPNALFFPTKSKIISTSPPVSKKFFKYTALLHDYF